MSMIRFYTVFFGYSLMIPGVYVYIYSDSKCYTVSLACFINV